MADRQTLVTRYLFELGREPNQRLITELVTELVVEQLEGVALRVRVLRRLEAVQVRHDQRQATLFRIIPGDLVCEVVAQEPTIADSGQLVFENQAGGIGPGVIKEI